MKTIKIFSLSFLSLIITLTSFAQSKTESIKVHGNCGMCENKIEKAAISAGASTAEWDSDSKMLKVSYSTSTTNAAKIQQAIAGVGYDTRDFRATDESYDKLHGCCKYERATAKETKACCANCEMKDGKCSGNCKEKGCCKDEKACKEHGCCSKDGAMKADCCSKEDGKTASAAGGKSCCSAAH